MDRLIIIIHRFCQNSAVAVARSQDFLEEQQLAAGYRYQGWAIYQYYHISWY